METSSKLLIWRVAGHLVDLVRIFEKERADLPMREWITAD